MIIKQQKADFVGGRKTVPFHKAKMITPKSRSFGEGLSFQFRDDETNHESEIEVHKSNDGKYISLNITRTTNNPNVLATKSCTYSIDQILCMTWMFEQLASKELEEAHERI